MPARFRRRSSLTLVGASALVLAMANPAAAPSGVLDTTFDGDGKVTTDFAGRQNLASAVAIQGDGKIVTAGAALLGSEAGLLGAAGDITLASTSDAGVKGNFSSFYPTALSADGTKVALVSTATNLDPADAYMDSDPYVKNLLTGDIILASTSDAGAKANHGNYLPALSADGTKAAFTSTATNLDPADTDAGDDVYVKNLQTGDIILASTSDTGAKGNLSADPSLSADGAIVAFSSQATNLDPADTYTDHDVYVKNLQTGDIILASTSDTGAKANFIDSFSPSLSADGTRVAFESLANLDPADTDVGPDVYVKNVQTGDIILASTSDTGAKGNDDSYLPSLSADGTRVAFESLANLDPTDTDTRMDVYVKNLQTGDIILASTSDTGAKGNLPDPFGSREPALSGDGTKVAFLSTATNLDPADTDTDEDVYVKNLQTGDIILASTSDTGAKSNGRSFNLATSADGTKVAFVSTATNLDPADTDTIHDVYMKELFGGKQPSPSPTGLRFRRPVDSKRIVPGCEFNGRNCARKGLHHTGVDYDYVGRSAIRATADGVLVAKIRNPQSHRMGKTIILRHQTLAGKTIYSLYAHLKSFAGGLKKCVPRGKKIGTMGDTGFALGVHLHFEMKIKGVLHNPAGPGRYWGYTSGPAQDFGYRNPGKYIGKVRAKTLCM